MKTRPLALKPSFCALVLLILAGCTSGGSSPEDVVVGNRAPDFALTSLDGKTIKSSSLKGNVVVLNFWATWCQPCRGEIPELNEFAANSKAIVVGIALDQEGIKTVRPFVKDLQINYTVLLGDEEIFQQFNGVGIPYTLVLDRSQRIVRIYRGPATKESLEQDLRQIEQGT